VDRRGRLIADSTAARSADVFASLTEIGKGKAQGEIPQAHGAEAEAVKRQRLEITQALDRRLDGVSRRDGTHDRIDLARNGHQRPSPPARSPSHSD
jgi:hypothetical protein